MKNKWDLITLFEQVNKTSIRGSIKEGSTFKRTPLIVEGLGEIPFEKIIEYFDHYKFDVRGLDQNIVREVFKNKDRANFEGLSDMEENPDGSLSVELDGAYGRHWMSFKNNDDFQKYYNETIIGDGRTAFEELYKEFEQKANEKKKQADFSKTTTNTLGNTHGDVLSQLKSKMAGLGEDSSPREGNRIVLAKNLKTGDHIVGLGKGLIVVQGATAGIKTPSGKVEIVVQYPNGTKHLKIWNKDTKIAIYDNPPTIGQGI